MKLLSIGRILSGEKVLRQTKPTLSFRYQRFKHDTLTLVGYGVENIINRGWVNGVVSKNQNLK
jgi:hypothetical protein